MFSPLGPLIPANRSHTQSEGKQAPIYGNRSPAESPRSGYRILDNSALEAVRKWKFHPATIGGVKVSSTVKVPVRFTLD